MVKDQKNAFLGGAPMARLLRVSHENIQDPRRRILNVGIAVKKGAISSMSALFLTDGAIPQVRVFAWSLAST